MEYHLKHRNELRPIKIPQKARATVLCPQTMPAQQSFAKMLGGALDGTQLGKQLRRKKPSRIAIAVPVINQPVAMKTILPILTQYLFHALPGLEPAAVTILVGNGLQAPPADEMIHEILAFDMVRGCNVFSHDPYDALMTDFGTTRRGTPVRINATFGEADFKMVVGHIEPHHFFGFTGGTKAATIGCASAESIRHNHRLIGEKHVHIGSIEGNPLREDLDEAGRMVGIDFAIDVVLNADKHVVRILAGEPQAVLEQGAEICAAVFGVALPKKFDIVLASCVDSARYNGSDQTLKGFNLVCGAVNHGGKILLLVDFQKGFGGDVYFDYVCPYAEPQSVIKDFNNFGATMGAGEADLFGSMLCNYTVEDDNVLNRRIMRSCQLRAADPSRIIEEWVDDFEGTPAIAIIPHAVTTFFYNI